MKRFNVRLEDDLAQKISEIEQETGKPQSEIIRRIMQLGLEHWSLKQQYGTPKPFGENKLMVAERKALSAAMQTLFMIRKLVPEDVSKTARADAEARLMDWWHYGDDE